MRREISAAAILLLLLLFSLWNLRQIDALTGEIEKLLYYSYNAAEQGDFDEAENAAAEALDIWLNADGYTHIFIRHPEIDGTSDAFYELLSALREKDTELLSPAYGKLIYHLDSIDRMEHLTLGSML